MGAFGSIVRIQFESWEELEAALRSGLAQLGAEPGVADRTVARIRGVFERLERTAGLQKVHATDPDAVVAAIESMLNAQRRNVHALLLELLVAVYELESLGNGSNLRP
jgi:hypothetical protein